MSITKWGMGVVALTLLAGSVYASDVADMKAEMAELKARLASMESAQMAPAAGGDCASLTSMKKKGAIKIGGAVEMGILVKHRDDQDQQANDGDVDDNSGDDDVDSTQFRTFDADLDFLIEASKNVSLFIKLDLDDAWGGYGVNTGMNGDDDLLEEIYFTWKNIRGTTWNLKFGKMEAPFGVDRDIGPLESYVHNGFMSAFWAAEANDGAADAYGKNPQARVGSRTRPGEIDNVFAITPSYTWKELLKLELCLYQANNARGMNEDRAEDNLFFQSFCGRLTLTPIEGLKLVLSAVNNHQDSMNNGEDRLAAGTVNAENDAEDDVKAVSFGVNYKFKSVPVELYGEYIHGWDANYNDEYATDDIQLGAVWGVTKEIDLHIQGEWLGIDNDTQVTPVAGSKMDEDYYRLLLGADYKFANGIKILFHYQHEWYDRDSNQANARDIDADGDMFYLGTAWSF